MADLVRCPQCRCWWLPDQRTAPEMDCPHCQKGAALQARIVHYVQRHPGVNTWDVAEHCEIAPVVAGYELRRLQNKSVLNRHIEMVCVAGKQKTLSYWYVIGQKYAMARAQRAALTDARTHAIEMTIRERLATAKPKKIKPVEAKPPVAISKPKPQPQKPPVVAISKPKPQKPSVVAPKPALTDLEIEKGVTEKDLAWQAFYRNRFLQRQQRQESRHV